MIRLVCLIAVLIGFGMAPAGAEQITFGRFGSVAVYREKPSPSHVVLFVSGDGGWNQGVVDMARTLAGIDALVLGIDIVAYFNALGQVHDECVYPAADFEALSQFAQRKFSFGSYRAPVLVGYSSGATLVYATLVQAPANTFRGAISLGFCPDLILPEPMCHGRGLHWRAAAKQGVVFLPAENLEAPWIALQGTADQVCDPEATRVFVEKVPRATITMLPKVGHGFSVERNWMPQFKAAFAAVAAWTGNDRQATVEDLADLPLVEVAAKDPATDTLAVIVSGDGGWAGIDRDVARGLSEQGFAVVGLDSLRYFWKRRTADEIGKDLDRILRHYLAAWDKNDAVLIGYSLGADVLPFMASRLGADLRARIRLIGLLGPSERAEFEFHVADWLGDRDRETSDPVRPELERLSRFRILCFYGREEAESLCRALPNSLAQAIESKGGHHFGGDYQAIVARIIEAVRE